MHVQDKRGLLFRLLSYLYKTKHACSKQVGDRILVCSVNVVIMNHVCSNQFRGYFCNTKNCMYVQDKLEAAF